MGSFSVLFKASAEKELRELPHLDRQRVVRKITGLSKNPRPRGCEKLTGQDFYRVRQGNWRIIYEVDPGEHIVRIFRIGHRGDVYR